MIYEEVVKGQLSKYCELMVKAIPVGPGFMQPTLPETLALTQVNQQIRKEFLPIFSRGLWITICTGTEEDRIQARKWLAVTYNELINNVDGFCFAPCKVCSEHLMIPVDDANSFEVGRVEFCGRIPFPTRDRFIAEAEGKVRKLETTHHGRRNMTKTALEDIMEILRDVEMLSGMM